MLSASDKRFILKEVCVEPWRLQVPIDQQCAQPFDVEMLPQIGQRHRPTNPALVGVEGVEHRQPPVRSGLLSDFCRSRKYLPRLPRIRRSISDTCPTLTRQREKVPADEFFGVK